METRDATPLWTRSAVSSAPTPILYVNMVCEEGRISASKNEQIRRAPCVQPYCSLSLRLLLALLAGETASRSVSSNFSEHPEGLSAFKVILDATGVTASPLALRNLTLIENGTAERTGSINLPASILFLAGAGFRLRPCLCKSAQIKLFFPTREETFTLLLARILLVLRRHSRSLEFSLSHSLLARL